MITSKLKVDNVRWIYGCIHPAERLVEYGSDGHLYLATDWYVVLFYLAKEYERQIRSELTDPEWPSSYWESKEVIT